ncbi:hypothetical protein M9Y10_037590 [Tritrichomonas musculus]|uniref:Uncharacterized protein n=1 Tax=Tritrichomonas musculus TaxID=1915356 RepID=A0ABR2GRS9_9EUKA
MIFTLLSILTSAIPTIQVHFYIRANMVTHPAFVKFYYKTYENGELLETKDLNNPQDNIQIQIRLPGKIKVYVVTKTCEDKLIIDQEIDISPNDIILNESNIPDICKVLPKTYYINIENELDDQYGARLFVNTWEGKEVEVRRGASYRDSNFSIQPFSVELYYTTHLCPTKQFIANITASTSIFYHKIDKTNISEECLPYEICIYLNSPYDYEYSYTFTEGETPKIYDRMGIKKVSNESFEVQIYVTKAPESTNCPANKLIGTYYSAKNYECKSIKTQDLLPDECVILNKVCLNTSQISEDLKLGYSLVNDSKNVIPLPDTPVSNRTKFELYLFLIDSHYCHEPKYITRYFSSTELKCEELDEYKIQHFECRKPYSSTLLNKLSLQYKLYYTKYSQSTEYYKIDYVFNQFSQKLKLNYPFYIESPKCENATLIDKKIEFTYNYSYIQIIDDKDVPTQCLSEDDADNLENDKVEDFLDISNTNNFNNELNNTFKQLNTDKKNKDKTKVVLINAENDAELPFNLNLDENQSMFLVNYKAKIKYIGGNLRLQLNENGNNIVLDNTGINLGLLGKYNRTYRTPINITLNDERQRAVSKININLLSDISLGVNIHVPYGVTAKFDSIRLSDYNDGLFAIYSNYLDENNYTQRGTYSFSVKDITAYDTSTTLMRAIDVETLTIDRSYIILSYVFFKKDASIIINYNNSRNDQLYFYLEYSRKKTDIPTIYINDIDKNVKPTKNKYYPLARGIFLGQSCEDWGKKLDFSNSQFNDWKCVESAIDQKDLQIRKKSSNVGLIVGVVVGVVAVIAIVAVVVVIVIKKKKYNNSESEEVENTGAQDV